MPKIRIPRLETEAPQAFLRSIIYSVAGQGKSPLLCTLPDHMYPAVLWAADPTTPFLDSIEPIDRDRIISIEPDGWVEKYAGRERYYDEGAAICLADWANWGEGVEEIIGTANYKMVQREWTNPPRTFLWDTVSLTADSLLQQNAREKNVSGDLEGGGHAGMGLVNAVSPTGALTESVQPGRPDYLLVQNSINQYLTWLFKHRMHVLVAAQEGQAKGAMGSESGWDIGPITAGSGSVRGLAQRFTTNFHLQRELEELSVWMQPHGNYIATFKTHSGNKIPERVVLPNDPQARRDFWQWVLDLKFGTSNDESPLESVKENVDG